MRSDHLSNKKPGGVSIYYKSYLPLRIIDINHLIECVRFETSLHYIGLQVNRITSIQI